jgi:hypothetical protein
MSDVVIVGVYPSTIEKFSSSLFAWSLGGAIGYFPNQAGGMGHVR